MSKLYHLWRKTATVFCGSGSTGKAAVLEGFSFIGIDKDAEYLAIAEKRIAWAMAQVESQCDPQMPLLEVP